MRVKRWSIAMGHCLLALLTTTLVGLVVQTQFNLGALEALGHSVDFGLRDCVGAEWRDWRLGVGCPCRANFGGNVWRSAVDVVTMNRQRQVASPCAAFALACAHSHS